MRPFPIILVGVALAGAAGCKDDKRAPTTDEQAKPLEQGKQKREAEEARAEGEQGLRARVVLTGGEHAGTYEATPAGAGCIDYQSGGVDGMGIAYYGDLVEGQGIVVVDFGTKAKVPTSGATDKFGFSVAVGKGGTPRTYPVQPERGQGSGTATVTGTGPRYTVKVTGKTADGVGVEATLECLK